MLAVFLTVGALLGLGGLLRWVLKDAAAQAAAYEAGRAAPARSRVTVPALPESELRWGALDDRQLARYLAAH